MRNQMASALARYEEHQRSATARAVTYAPLLNTRIGGRGDVGFIRGLHSTAPTLTVAPIQAVDRKSHELEISFLKSLGMILDKCIASSYPCHCCSTRRLLDDSSPVAADIDVDDDLHLAKAPTDVAAWFREMCEWLWKASRVRRICIHRCKDGDTIEHPDINT